MAIFSKRNALVGWLGWMIGRRMVRRRLSRLLR
jgi:hypothetical protein